MLRSILISLLIAGLMLSFGCSGSPTVPTSADKDMDTFFAGVSPNPTGVVGEYSYVGNDGSMETGQVVALENGEMMLVGDREASVYKNWLFTIDTEYVNPRYYSPNGLPVYYLGDTFTYKLHIKYKTCIGLVKPFSWSDVTAEQRYWPSLNPLPGEYSKTWEGVEFPACSKVTLEDTYTIPTGATPGNDCTTVKIVLNTLCGCLKIKIACGICGFWDP